MTTTVLRLLDTLLSKVSIMVANDVRLKKYETFESKCKPLNMS